MSPQFRDPLRFHKSEHLAQGTFGADRFGVWAERFARFFGTPKFIIGQTIIVVLWIVGNVITLQGVGTIQWDPYPFILLNLCFSTQAAYAAPLILLAQTRQSDRDKATTEADAKHREEVARESAQLLQANTRLTENVAKLVTENTELTTQVKELLETVHAQVSGTSP